MNNFEHSLEVWRQLWRTIERSDVLLLLTDARNPLFHFNKTLFDLLQKQNKPVIIVLTKIDLIDKCTLQSWKNYFL